MRKVPRWHFWSKAPTAKGLQKGAKKTKRRPCGRHYVWETLELEECQAGCNFAGSRTGKMLFQSISGTWSFLTLEGITGYSHGTAEESID
jgi:hypothetical protein